MVDLYLIDGHVVFSAEVVPMTVSAVVGEAEVSMVCCIHAVAAGHRGKFVTATDRAVVGSAGRAVVTAADECSIYLAAGQVAAVG